MTTKILEPISKSHLEPVMTRRSPRQLEMPSFVLCPPFSHSTANPNNVWMQELPSDDLAVDHNLGFVQFHDLYNFIASESLVYLLPSPADCGLQDLVFTANLGIVLPHMERDTVVVSNFTSKPRHGESEVGVRFFEMLGFETSVCPFRFEGEAELKHLYDNVYIGGYGERSEIAAYRWMEDQYDMKIVTIEETSPYLYHLDCSVFPLTDEETLVCTSVLKSEEIKAIEAVTGIIDVTEDEAMSGICNSVRLHNVILNASNFNDLIPGTEDFTYERGKNRKLEDICADRGFEPAFFNLSEYMKSGALLSCMVMHMNRHSYSYRLV